MRLKILQDHDAFDLTDNDITALANFPLSPRVRTLLLARNRILSIQSSIASSLPNLTTLVLTANNLAELADLDPLKGCARLTHLTLLENPLVRKEVSRHLMPDQCNDWSAEARIALPILGHLAIPDSSIPRLSESQGYGAG